MTDAVRPTFDSVIVGVDGTDQGKDALMLGRLLAPQGPRTVLVAHVMGGQPRYFAQTHDYVQERRERLRRVLDPLLSEAAGDERLEPASIDSNSPAHGLYELADEQRRHTSTVLVIGSTHRGRVGRVVLGSVGEILCSGTPCPIAVAPRGYAEHPRTTLGDVVVGFDDSPEAHSALNAAHALARAAGSALRVVAVVHHSILHAPHQSEATSDAAALQERVDTAISRLDGDVDTSVVEGDPVDRLAEAATGAGILVLGSRGYGPMHHVLAGSVSAKLMRCAPSPVLVLPRSVAG
jgi:nucleotide-binding universal stress UspA family protein